MPKLSADRLPKYRHHKSSGLAVVELSGKTFYLGPHGTRTSKLEYDRLIAEWLANDRRLPTASDSSDLTIVEMLAAWRRHALKHYRKDGRPTGELVNFDHAIRPLNLLYGREPVRDFGPLKLQTIQAMLVAGYHDPKRGAIRGLSRGSVNGRVARIKRIFRWAVSQEMAPPSLAHALDTVRGLQRGRTEARETEPVKPVDDAAVDATLPYLPSIVADMVRVQRLTGCRPGEMCSMRPADIDRNTSPWQYRPASFKTAHFGGQRMIFIGPKAQAVLLPYLLRESHAYCFSPADSEKNRKAQLRANRKTRVQPSQGDRRMLRPKVQPTDKYNKDAYARAVRRACDQAGIPRWAPNRLRHAAATKIRQQFGGIEAAQAVLGHSKSSTTEIYAERNQRLAADIIKQIG